VPEAAGTSSAPHDSPDRLLTETGAALAAAVEAAVPGWVRRAVDGVLEAWTAAGGVLGPEAGDTDAVQRRAAEAGEAARRAVSDDLRRLLAADVDAQWTTPLSVVRALVVFPTDVLEEAGVSPRVRDRFDEERFPGDPYGLTPASLSALGPEVGALALAWGAAKAAAHRARHGSAGRHGD
jgi:hypothetical protein